MATVTPSSNARTPNPANHIKTTSSTAPPLHPVDILKGGRQAVAALTARTEGWAAGLQLAGLSLRGHADPAGFAVAFGGSHRFVLDYRADEVLDGQPAAVRGFLLETSVLERLTGELCDAVTGRPGSQAMQIGRAHV